MSHRMTARRAVASAVGLALLSGGIGAAGPAAASRSGRRVASAAAVAPCNALGVVSIAPYPDGGLQSTPGLVDPLVFDAPLLMLNEYLYGTSSATPAGYDEVQEEIAGTAIPGVTSESLIDWEFPVVTDDSDHPFDPSTDYATLSLDSSQFTAGQRYHTTGTAFESNGTRCAVGGDSFQVLAATQVLTAFTSRHGNAVTISPRTMVFDLRSGRWRPAPEPVRLLRENAKGSYTVVRRATTNSAGSATFHLTGSVGVYKIVIAATRATAGDTTPPFSQ